jgi:uncharacterized membrane protein YoaK (UPF0700 family)
LVPLRNKDPSRASSPDLPEPRASRPSITPNAVQSGSLAPRASLLPSASVHLHSVLLSGVAGYVDAAGFTALVGLLPAHVTGELISDAIALSSAHAGAHVHLWVLPVFLAAIVSATFVARIQRRRGQRPLAALLALLTAALALFSLSDALALLLHEVGRMPILIGGSCAVAAMGFQNALMRESLKTSCPTTVMTGNLTQVVVDLADRAFSKILRPSPYDRKPRSRLGPVSAALGAFLACAVLGGWLTRKCGSCGAALPTAVTAFLAVRAWREDRGRIVAGFPLPSLSAARVPSFEPAQVWPDSLMPSLVSRPLLPQAPADPGSVTQLRSAQALPLPAPIIVASVSTPNRGVLEKRTISGTQLAQRFRDDKSEPD